MLSSYQNPANTHQTELNLNWIQLIQVYLSLINGRNKARAKGIANSTNIIELNLGLKKDKDISKGIYLLSTLLVFLERILDG